MTEEEPGAELCDSRIMRGFLDTEGESMAKNESITGEDVKSARATAGMTQEAAAAVVHTSIHNWRNWEQGRFSMAQALYELFLLKTGQFTLQKAGSTAEHAVLRLRLRSGRVIEMPVKSEVMRDICASVGA